MIKLKKVPGKFCNQCAIRKLLREPDKSLYAELEEICREADCKSERIIFVEVVK